MKGQFGAERYRIGVSGNTVQAWDTQKQVMLGYFRQRLMDGSYRLDVSGSMQVKQGQVADFSAQAATTGYVFGRDGVGIVLSRKATPNWKLHLSQKRKTSVNPLSPSRAVLKFNNGELALLDLTGIYRLVPQTSPQSDKPKGFQLMGDFSP